MSPRKTICYFVLSGFFVTSCTKDVENLKLPDFEPKLLLSAFISPDLPENELSINCHNKNFGKYSPPEPPGIVTIRLSDGIQELVIDTALLESHDNKIILRNMPLTYGNQASIKIVNDEGLIAEAQCKVPVKRDFNFSVDTTREITFDPYYPSDTYFRLILKVSVTDFPGEANYFRLLISVKSFQESEVFSGGFDMGDDVFSDKGRDGKRLVLRSFELNSLLQADSSFLYIYLLNTNKEYYDFHKSLVTAWDTGEGNPFAEPAPLYSNVSNGIGIFAAYTVDSLIFRVK